MTHPALPIHKVPPVTLESIPPGSNISIHGCVGTIQRNTDTCTKAVLSAYDRPPSCRKGCSACCTINVTVNFFEAMKMVYGMLGTHAGRARVIELLPEMRRQTELLAHPKMNTLRWAKTKTDCVFLRQHLCEVYADRPFQCRTFHVFTPAADCAVPGRSVQMLPTQFEDEVNTTPLRNIAHGFGLPNLEGPLPFIAWLATVALSLPGKDALLDFLSGTVFARGETGWTPWRHLMADTLLVGDRSGTDYKGLGICEQGEQIEDALNRHATRHLANFGLTLYDAHPKALFSRWRRRLVADDLIDPQGHSSEKTACMKK